MHVENKQNCTGCGACYNICPKGAISMQNDEYGFYKPAIYKEKCINCGLCEKHCPIDNYKSGNIESPKVYAFQNNDEGILYKCASGGAFAAIAKYVIEHGGVVYGVVYDADLNVCHAMANNLTDLEEMYSSKYVQSDTKATFKSASADLQKGRTVLYSGTPCQIAGLKSYLGKDYENLITIDLVCHGVPSPLVFEKYKQEINKKFKNNEKIKTVNFRSKINGWNPYCLNIKTDKNDFYIQSNQSIYTKLFLNNLSINDSCFSCQFNGLPRTADITVGDFWGVNEYDKTINNNKGLSIVILNSGKGAEIFSKIRNQCFSKEVPLDVVIKHNSNIVMSSIPHSKRKEFLDDIKKGKSLKSCVKKYVKSESVYMMLYRLLPQFVKDFIKYKILRRDKCLK